MRRGWAQMLPPQSTLWREGASGIAPPARPPAEPRVRQNEAQAAAPRPAPGARDAPFSVRHGRQRPRSCRDRTGYCGSILFPLFPKSRRRPLSHFPGPKARGQEAEREEGRGGGAGGSPLGPGPQAAARERAAVASTRHLLRPVGWGVPELGAGPGPIPQPRIWTTKALSALRPAFLFKPF